MNGIPIGLKDLYYAKLVESSDVESGTPVYEAPKKIAGAIQANINPNASSETIFADDGPFETAATTGKIGLELNVADLSLAVQADILGHEKAGGVLLRKANDIPPWVAIGFKSLKSNGRYRFTWLLKGKFAEPEQNNQTKGDSVNFNTPTISGNFVMREADALWQRMADEDDVDYMPAIGQNWFTSPNGNAGDKIAPTITTVVPADGAAAVAKNGTIVWTFDKALALSTVTLDNFLLTTVAGVAVDGALTINAARTEVTFTPAAALTGSTEYMAIVTTNVKDINGNKLADVNITSFTTVA